MAKIRLLDILQKDHGTGPISLVQELERKAGKGKVRLLDQVRRRGSDNEVLACYHVPELKAEKENLQVERNTLEEFAINFYKETEKLKKDLQYSQKKQEDIDDQLDAAEARGKKEGFVTGMTKAVENTLMHKLDGTAKGFHGPIYYSQDAMEEMHQEVKKHPKFSQTKNKSEKTMEVKGMGQDPVQAIGAFLTNLDESLAESQRLGYMKDNAFPLVVKTKDYAYPTDAYITKPTPISQMIRGFGYDPDVILPRTRYRYK